MLNAEIQRRVMQVLTEMAPRLTHEDRVRISEHAGNEVVELVAALLPVSGSTGEVPCEECSGVLVHMIDCSRRVKHHPTDAKPFDTSLEPVKNGLDSSHVPTGEEQG